MEFSLPLTMFLGITGKSKPVDSNKIIPIDTPLKVGIDSDLNKPHRFVSFKDNKSYIQAVKKYISNNTNLEIQFDDDPYIKDTYIKPDGINEIIILKIKSHETLIVQTNNGEYYARSRNNQNNQNSYGSYIMDSETFNKMLLDRYFNGHRK